MFPVRSGYALGETGRYRVGGQGILKGVSLIPASDGENKGDPREKNSAMETVPTPTEIFLIFEYFWNRGVL